MRKLLFALLLLLPSLAAGAAAQTAPSPSGLPEGLELDLSAVVGVEATILPEGRTADSLGQTRRGTGVVIDGADGLVLTIGYVVLEAAAVDLLVGDPAAGGRRVPAEVLAYDYDTGFGILRATRPLGLEAMAIGESAAVAVRQPLLSVAWESGEPSVAPALLLARRDFAGYWEYLLPDALFAAPRRPDWAGAALVDGRGRLVGIGSLQVGDSLGAGPGGGPVVPGNMYVPIDALKPIYGELVSFGRTRAAPRPWLGLYSQELRGQVVVTRVAERGPAAEAGIEPGEIVVAVGGERVAGLADFYRKLWALGDAGVEVELSLLGPDGRRSLTLTSADRYDFLRLDQTL